jgi:hypothetical protein
MYPVALTAEEDCKVVVPYPFYFYFLEAAEAHWPLAKRASSLLWLCAEKLGLLLGEQRLDATALRVIRRSVKHALKVLDVFAMNETPHRFLPLAKAASRSSDNEPSAQFVQLNVRFSTLISGPVGEYGSVHRHSATHSCLP